VGRAGPRGHSGSMEKTNRQSGLDKAQGEVHAAGITAIQFCPLDADLPGIEWMGSNSGGFRDSGPGPIRWPHTHGAEAEDLGNVLEVAALPATVDLAIRLAAHGVDKEELELLIFTGSDATAPTWRSRGPVYFTPALDDEPLGFATLGLPLRAVPLRQEGVHWLTARLGADAIRLPFIVRATRR
jgi:hypothetical protein